MAFRNTKNGKAFRMGQRDGIKFRNSGLNGATNWGVQARHTKAIRPNTGPWFSSNEKDGFRFDLGLLLLTKTHPVLPKEERTGMYKRMNPEAEKVVLSKMRMYRKCTKNCIPKAKGFGCKGWQYFASCPQPKFEDEVKKPLRKIEKVDLDKMTPSEQKRWLDSQVDWGWRIK